MRLVGSFSMGIFSISLALIDLLLLMMNADSLIKSINMLSKIVVEMMKISEYFFKRRTRTW